MQKQSCDLVRFTLTSKQNNLVSHWDTFLSLHQIIIVMGYHCVINLGVSTDVCVGVCGCEGIGAESK